ncbi:hypothetical protein BBP40_007218 [Aspergillus hancockii]|nr:hypothetical protein BBP40_007218 [Aspergillus hancockii]
MQLFNWLFKSPKESCAPQTNEPIWDPNTLTMQQPSSPQGPTTDRADAERSQNTNGSMEVGLRGGGGGGVCWFALF